MKYTPKQACEFAHIAPSTLRYYSKKFAKYLSFNPAHKHRRYTEADLVTLREIRSRSYHHKIDEIENFLIPPTDPLDKGDGNGGETLEEKVDVLCERVNFLVETVKKYDATYQELNRLAISRNQAISGIVKEFREIEPKLKINVSYLNTFQAKIHDLEIRIRQQEARKFSLLGGG